MSGADIPEEIPEEILELPGWNSTTQVAKLMKLSGRQVVHRHLAAGYLDIRRYVRRAGDFVVIRDWALYGYTRALRALSAGKQPKLHPVLPIAELAGWKTTKQVAEILEKSKQYVNRVVAGDYQWISVHPHCLRRVGDPPGHIILIRETAVERLKLALEEREKVQRTTTWARRPEGEYRTAVRRHWRNLGNPANPAQPPPVEAYAAYREAYPDVPVPPGIEIPE